MTVTAAAFRVNFPVFTSTAVYPDAEVNFWIGVAVKMLRPERWLDMLDEGMQMFVAHMLALERQATLSGSTNGIPGTGFGILTSASVSKVSWSKDIQSVMELDAGHWNLTVYGLRFIRWARMFGAGPIQVGVENLDTSQSVWFGPFMPWP